jgi:hypothetical protein
VIKIGDAFHSMERFVGMTFHTVLPELVLMRIGMAVRAVLKFDTGEFLEFLFIFNCNRMAFHTGNTLVHARQRILCIGMVEFHSRFEGIVGMAIGTCSGDRFLMVIGMAGKAVGVYAQIGEFLGFCFGFRDILFFVAILALFLCMGACQFETCKVVVELILVKPDDLEIDPMMVIVAAYTILTADLRRSMVPSFLINAGFDLGVAFEAFCVGHLVPERMALCAV